MSGRKNIKYHVIIIGALAVFAAYSFFPRGEEEFELEPELTAEVVEPLPEPKMEYGLPLDSFLVYEDKISEGQVVSDILLKHHIPWGEIDLMVRRAKPVFDVRYIKSGKKYCVLASPDSTEKACYFVYEQDPVNYVVFDLQDTMRVYKGERPVDLVEKEVSGTINSSLYQSLVDNGASAELVMELATIYAWTIDFYRIQKGDEFRVIYEEKEVNGQSVGINKIKAAMFDHWNNEYYAFRFEQDGIKDFYDENAKSLRKTFLKAPLKYSRISSRYTKKRFHPVQKRWKAHLGTDYAAPEGTPILAVGNGVITEAKYKKYNGNYVKIKHNGTYTTQYLHMSKIGQGIKPGVRVQQGQVIGYVGSTGLATGPHVCFRFWKNGEQVDHLKEKFPPSEPVKDEHMTEYNTLIESLKARLDAMGEQAEVVS